jgi:hypothetical protein
MPEAPMQQLSGDFFGPFKNGTYWFVNYDEYSRYAAVDEVRSVSFENASPVLKQLFTRIGTPESYKTDNGSPFQSHDFAFLMHKWGVKHHKITPMWPRANGEVERFMKNLGKVVKTAKIEVKYTKQALEFLRTYNDTPHSSTGVVPSLLMFGHSSSCGLPQMPITPAAYNNMHQLAVKNDQVAKQRMERAFNERMRAREPLIRVGSRVQIKLQKLNKSTPD